MDQVQLTAEPRSELGTRVTRRLRISGRLPVNLYGHQQEAQNLHVDARAFNDAVRHHARVITLDVGGKAQPTVIHAVQYHPLGQQIIHVDFLRVDLTVKIEVPVPLKIAGPSAGELQGGILMELHSEVMVRCLPTEIPNEIDVDIREVLVGQAIHIKELVAPEGIELVGDPELAVLTIAEPRYSADEEESAESGDAEEGAEGEEVKPEDDDSGS